MTWHRINIAHARKHRVETYLRQNGSLIEALHACESVGICQSAQFVVGCIQDIRFDQDDNVIAWEEADLPAYCFHPELDCRHNQIIEGFEPKIADLRYGIANMMNRVFSDRSFSSYAKKQMIGSWICRTSSISFSHSGEYSVAGEARDIAPGTPERGVWSLVNNQLVLLDPERKGGVRTQLVQVDGKDLVFHGRSNFLFQKYKKQGA